MLPFAFTTSDLIAGVAALVVVAGTAWNIRQDVTKRGAARILAAERHAGQDATMAAHDSEIARALDRMTGEFKEFSGLFRQHDRDCAAFKAQQTEISTQQAALLEKHERSIEALKSQIRNVAGPGRGRIMEYGGDKP